MRHKLRVDFREQAERWNSNIYAIVTDSPIEYRLKPNLHIQQRTPTRSGVENWEFTVNSAGFRGKEFSVLRERRGPRVVFLGDSYTFGWAVNDSETLPAQLEARLARANGRVFECLNLGVPGYNTIQEAALLDVEIEALEPDLVVLDYVMNDAEPQLTVPVSPEVTFRHAPSWILGLIAKVATPRFRSRWPLLDNMEQHHDFDYLAGFSSTSQKWRDSRRAMEKIVRLCNRSGIPLLVAILPDFTQPFDQGYRYKLIHREVSAWAEELGVEVHDLLPNFSGERHEDFWVEGDGHPNRAAFERIAGAVEARAERLLWSRSSDLN